MKNKILAYRAERSEVMEIYKAALQAEGLKIESVHCGSETAVGTRLPMLVEAFERAINIQSVKAGFDVVNDNNEILAIF